MAWVGNSANSWILILTIIIPILFGGAIGYFQGRRKAIYYNSVILIAWVVTALIFMFVDITGKISSLIFSSDVVSGLDKGSLFEKALNSYNGLIFAIILFIVILVSVFLAFLIGFFFRGFLNAKLKEKKEEGSSSVTYRLSGLGIGLVSAIPFASSLSSMSAITTSDSTLTKLNSNVLYALSFGKTNTDVNSGQDIKYIWEIANAIIDNSKDGSSSQDGLQSVFEAIFSGKNETDPNKIDAAKKALEENKKILENALSSPIMIDILLPEVIKDFGGDTEIDIISNPDVDISNIFDDNTKIQVSESNQKAIKDLLQKELNFTSGTTDEEKSNWLDKIMTSAFKK